jgi:hypothetical protein
MDSALQRTSQRESATAQIETSARPISHRIAGLVSNPEGKQTAHPPPLTATILGSAEGE